MIWSNSRRPVLKVRRPSSLLRRKGCSESDEENNKAEGSDRGLCPGPHEYANERDGCPGNESSERDQLPRWEFISHVVRD
jgi:hypothetical protein